ncbi:S8 family serine peptidase [Methanospirillum hungatei]|uniref:S8 family serine peptidase n=1 Tax=Methanospirillum hungatei TaxID=2203 RepID=UPI0026EF6F4A|nr:S8 family serine peptidase [Methanospirillum hungatei]MCA1916200.1 S8 family serine peptidase [Methanospirillum hungatei]
MIIPGNISSLTLLTGVIVIICVLTQAGTAIPDHSILSNPSPIQQISPPTVSPGGSGAVLQSSALPVSVQSVEVSTEYAPDRLIVRYNPDRPRAESSMMSIQSATNTQAGTSVVKDLSDAGIPGMQVVQVTTNTLDAAMEAYKNSPDVLYVEPDYKISLSPIEKTGKVADVNTMSISAAAYPNDPGYQYLWGLHNTGQAPFYGMVDADIDAPEAWGITTGSPNVVVAVVDTGVDYTHPDLAANIWQNSGEIINGVDDDGNGYIDDVRGWNFVSKNNDPMDDSGHGTHCAGTIAAVGNNGIGVTGTAWNVKIMPLKFLNAQGSGYVSDAISAILYANRKGAAVISNSWSGTGYTQSLKDAIDASSAVVVCAAGNSGANADSNPQYPAAFTSSNILSVAATDYNDKLASFSNYGPNSVDLAAPGVSIYSTSKSGTYQYLSGTSMATPHVSGVAALIKSQNPSMSATQIRSRIFSSVDAISSLSGKVGSGGRLNAAKALGGAAPTPTPTYTPYPTVTPTKTPTPTPTFTPSPTPTPTVSPTPKPGSDLSAAFYAAPTYGRAPLRVQFIDQSYGNPNRWTWSFGDGGFSYQKNPYHTYLKKGTFSVRLTVNRGGLASTVYKQRIITVT